MKILPKTGIRQLIRVNGLLIIPYLFGFVQSFTHEFFMNMKIFLIMYVSCAFCAVNARTLNFPLSTRNSFHIPTMSCGFVGFFARNFPTFPAIFRAMVLLSEYFLNISPLSYSCTPHTYNLGSRLSKQISVFARKNLSFLCFKLGK